MYVVAFYKKTQSVDFELQTGIFWGSEIKIRLNLCFGISTEKMALFSDLEWESLA